MAMSNAERAAKFNANNPGYQTQYSRIRRARLNDSNRKRTGHYWSNIETQELIDFEGSVEEFAKKNERSVRTVQHKINLLKKEGRM